MAQFRVGSKVKEGSLQCNVEYPSDIISTRSTHFTLGQTY